MKAVYQVKYGKSDVLQYGEQNSPAMKVNEVRIKNYAASVNPRDWLIRSGRYQLQFLVPKFPLILGSDFAGEVVEVGAKVSNFKRGDQVFGMKNPSQGLATYADEVVALERSMWLIPEGMSYIEAAGVPLCSLTAWQALVKKAKIKKGKKVLIIGAAGGVGSYGVQIAKALGAEVAAVCSKKNEALVSELGAYKVIDYHQQDFLKSGECYDIIFDTIGHHSLAKCSRVLNIAGTYVSTIPNSQNLKSMIFTRFKSALYKTIKKTEVVMVKPKGDDLAEVSKLISCGHIRAVIDQVFPLQQTAEALDYSRSLRAKGKIILDMK